VLAALTGTLVVVSGCSGVHSGGPLSLGGGKSVLTNFYSLNTPGKVEFGYNLMTNTGHSPITDIRPSLGGRKAHELQTSIVQYSVIELAKYPNLSALGVGSYPNSVSPTKAITPLAGYQLQPGNDAVELLYILDVKGTGYSEWQKTVIKYQYRGKTYKISDGSGLRICAPVTVDCSKDPPA
jgi:hypothetical protein